eukprot:COSAG01_NODE_2061_length_8482_cov_6.301925_15_plen_82_part_00
MRCCFRRSLRCSRNGRSGACLSVERAGVCVGWAGRPLRSHLQRLPLPRVLLLLRAPLSLPTHRHRQHPHRALLLAAAVRPT